MVLEHFDLSGRTDYTELRRQRNTMASVSLTNGNVTGNASQEHAGVSARVWHAGAWGFASAGADDRGAIDRVVGAAGDNARWLGTRAGRDLGALPSRPTSGVVQVFETSKPRWSRAQTVSFLRELDEHVASRYPQVTARTVALSCLDMHKQLQTSDGAESDQLIPRTILALVFTVVRNGEPVRLMEIHGGFGQLEDNFDDPTALHDAIAKQVAHLERKAAGVYARAGTHDLVLDASLAGILAHEAIGHTTEADLVLGGSVAGDRVGQEVATELVSLTDFAHTALGQQCPVPVWVDDEGVEAQDVPIIEKGVLKGFMHTKETALRFGVAPTGNARAFQYSDEPLVRMRNTSFLPGDSSLDDMIASVERGYYLVRPSNGQADATSEFMFGVTLGYEIVDGKLGEAIKDTTISGVAFDVLRTVSMVSDDMQWECGGMCGKKQPIPVGMGGPAIKCRAHLGGR
ncbi:MAG: TldD/PmbA family protein [Myxococcota bacterium]